MSDNKTNLTPAYEEPVTPVLDEDTNPVLDDAALEDNTPQPAQEKKKPSKEKKVTGKESFSRTRAIVGVLLIVAAIVTAVLLIPVLSGGDVMYDVLYAKADVPAGVQITDDNINQYFEVHTTPDKNLFNAGIPAAQAREIIGGCYTRRDIYKGKLATVEDFSRTNLIYSDKVPDGKLLISISIPSLQGNVGYMPQAGDVIKIYRMVTKEYDENDIYFDAANIHVPVGNGGAVTYAEPYEYLQYVEIYKAIDGDLQDADAAGTAEAVFVLLVNDGVQAKQVVEAANSGNYYFALVSSGDKGRKEAFLKLQDQIIKEGVSGAGRTEHLFSLEDLTKLNIVPKVNDTVRFGTSLSNGTTTSFEYHPLLKYVTVLSIYDQNHINMRLDVTMPEPLPGEEPEERKATYIGLNLSEEQAAYLQKCIDEGEVVMELVTETKDQIISGFDAVTDYLWNERAQNLMQAASPEAPATPEETPEGETENNESTAE